MFSTWAAKASVISSNKHACCLFASPIPQGVREKEWLETQKHYCFAYWPSHNMEVGKSDLDKPDVNLISHSLLSNQFNMKKHHH